MNTPSDDILRGYPGDDKQGGNGFSERSSKDVGLGDIVALVNQVQKSATGNLGFQETALVPIVDRMIEAAVHRMNSGDLKATAARMIGELGATPSAPDRIDISYLCGLHGYSYMGITSQENRSEPIRPMPRALLVKLYHSRPDVIPINRSYKPSDLHAMIRQVAGFESITQNVFAAMLGLERGSYHRYSTGGPASPVIDRFVATVCMYLGRSDVTYEDRVDLILTMLRNAIEEAVARGYDMALFRRRGFAQAKRLATRQAPKRAKSRPARPPTLVQLVGAARIAVRKGIEKAREADDQLMLSYLMVLEGNFVFARRSIERLAPARFRDNPALIQASQTIPACARLLAAARSVSES